MNNEDLISRAGLLEWAREFYPEEKQFQSAVINAPSAPPQVVHGRWKTINGKGCITGGGNPLWGCSKCGHIVGAMLLPPKYNYCPNCGAKMDGGEDDE